MENPVVKKGDKILLKQPNNGALGWKGKILEVESVVSDGSYCKVHQFENINAGTITVYANTRQTGKADEFCLADRKAQGAWMKEKAEELKKEAKKMEEEAKALLLYKDDAEEVAAKLELLFKQKGNRQKMAEILRTLKETHYI